MKTIRLDKLHPQDRDRLQSAWRILVAVGSTGVSAARIYPDNIDTLVETAVRAIETTLEA